MVGIQGSKIKPHVPSVRLYSMHRSVYYWTIKIFNHLPQNIFKFHNNLHVFKILLSDHLVINAFYFIEEFFSTDRDSQLAINILYCVPFFHCFQFYWILHCRYMNFHILCVSLFFMHMLLSTVVCFCSFLCYLSCFY